MPEQRLDFINNTFKQRVNEVKSTKYTTAAKDLLCMEAENEHVNNKLNYAMKIAELQLNLGKVKVGDNAEFDSLYKANMKNLTLPDKRSPV